MGILDDAIREHLELKRQHGAPGDDVERLEKEAFGPPTRPGDPDFEGEEEAGSDDERPEAAGDGEPEILTEGDGGATESESPDADAEVSSSPFDANLDVDWGSALEEDDDDDAGDPGSAPLTATEQARVEHPDLGDTVDHPAVPAPETGEQPSATFDEPAEAPEAAIFEQGDDGEDDLDDLDLELDADDAPATAEAPAPSAIPEGEEDADLRADFALDDLEEGSGGEPAPAEAPAPAPESAPPPESETDTGGNAGFEADDAEEDELEDDDEDLLEETPDFLQDKPDGERLWFEQGEPKDFDFDD